MSAAAIVAREKRIANEFIERGATSAATAMSYGGHQGLAWRKLVRHAVIREVPGRGFYVDVPSWEALCDLRRRIAFIAIAAALIAVGVVFLLAR